MRSTSLTYSADGIARYCGLGLVALYALVGLVLAGLLCWHVQEHLGLCLGLSLWLFGVLFFQTGTALSPWDIFYPISYRFYPPFYLFLDWLVFGLLLLMLGLALRAVWRRFDRPALLRLGLAVGLFAVRSPEPLPSHKPSCNHFPESCTIRTSILRQATKPKRNFSS